MGVECREISIFQKFAGNLVDDLDVAANNRRRIFLRLGMKAEENEEYDEKKSGHGAEKKVKGAKKKVKITGQRLLVALRESHKRPFKRMAKLYVWGRNSAPNWFTDGFILLFPPL